MHSFTKSLNAVILKAGLISTQPLNKSQSWLLCQTKNFKQSETSSFSIFSPNAIFTSLEWLFSRWFSSETMKRNFKGPILITWFDKKLKMDLAVLISLMSWKSAFIPTLKKEWIFWHFSIKWNLSKEKDILQVIHSKEPTFLKIRLTCSAFPVWSQLSLS